MTIKTKPKLVVRSIDIALVDPDPDQPRKIFNEAELNDLAASIRENGLLQPVTVRPVGKRFLIIAGERRWRAHKKLGLDKIKAQIVDGMSAIDVAIAQIIENDQRADVRPIDEARKFRELLCAGLSKTDLSTKLGRQVWRIEERLRLLDLEPALLKLYESGNLSQEAASEISRVKDHAQQTKLVQMVSRGHLVGYKAIRTAVDTIIDGKTQADIFGEAAPVASSEDLQTISRMEKKIETVVGMVASGWRDGECIVACRVNPNRALLTADKLAAIRRSLSFMEKELRNIAAQASVVLEAA